MPLPATTQRSRPAAVVLAATEGPIRPRPTSAGSALPGRPGAHLHLRPVRGQQPCGLAAPRRFLLYEDWPVPLVEKVICAFSRPRDRVVVLPWPTGSSSTAAVIEAANDLGRRTSPESDVEPEQAAIADLVITSTPPHQTVAELADQVVLAAAHLLQSAVVTTLPTTGSRSLATSRLTPGPTLCTNNLRCTVRRSPMIKPLWMIGSLVQSTGSSWRTSPRFAGATEDSTAYSATWPKQGMTRSGVASAPPTSAPRTDANVCSCFIWTVGAYGSASSLGWGSI